MSKDDGFSSIISEQADRQFRDLLTREALQAASAGRWNQDLWHGVEESALSLALVPEAQGGIGLDAVDAFEIVRLAGLRALPLPLGDTMIAKALWAAAGGDIGLAGDRPVLLASQAAGAAALLREVRGGMAVSLATEPIAFADVPASLLVHGRTADGQHYLLLLDTEGLARTRCTGPGLEPAFSLRQDDVVVAANRSLRWQPQHSLALQAHGALVRSMQMVGGMQRCLELGLQYAGERVQFGKAIAKFAPVQDMLVEAAAETAASVSAAGLALEHWQPDLDEDGVFCIAAAKTRCGEAAGKVSALIHQVHGAIGFTQEHVLHHHTRRLWAWRDDFGSESFWSQWIGEQACGAEGSTLWPRIASL